MAPSNDLLPLTEALGHTFADLALLERALTHRSCANGPGEPPVQHNERLEFLGDAVIDLVVGHHLMQVLPTASEGRLSKLRAMIVSEASFARAARGLGLGHFLRLGRGEEHSGGRAKVSILADAFEAVLGAVYLDGGFDVVAEVVRKQLGPLVQAAVSGEIGQDYKTRLQEFAQGQLKIMPRYSIVGTRGPDHQKVFQVSVSLGDEELAQAEGHSKKEAEQRAARKALGELSRA